LSLAKRLSEKLRLSIWLHNNGGGEIFRMVRTSHSGAPEEWFTTPQTVDFAALAKGFHLPFFRVHGLQDLEGLEAEAFSQVGVRVVELLFPDKENMNCRKKFWENFR
jgi:2-succinyl-5-enolpyruvyl-6-hydroxy-3-cyclohexene-1-carboxylate synthase